MLTRLLVRNFKRFDELDIRLDSPVLFIGPNNSGKTTALQALALWDLGMRRWREKGAERNAPKRPGVAINRRDLVTVPAPDAKHFWRDLRVRNVRRVEGKQRTSNIRVEVVVEGVTRGASWRCGLEFDYANAESFYCRPLRLDAKGDRRMEIPDEASGVRVAYLPPMSGLAMNELRLEPGGVNVRLGEGRTAEVLRNLCFQIEEKERSNRLYGDGTHRPWTQLVEDVDRLFRVRLDPPRHIPDRGEIAMSYRQGRIRLDLTASGRGMLQTTLVLAHLALNQGAVLVLDEPDAHLEIVRQRQTYALLCERARSSNAQLILASHSEVLLHEAAQQDMLIAFVGAPHEVAGQPSQVHKALRDIGYADFEQARSAGFVLYVEGTTDARMLRALAERSGHQKAREVLESAFVKPVGNQPTKALDHYWGLREAQPKLKAAALFDRLDRSLPDQRLPMRMWRRREIENYVCSRNTLLAFAEATAETTETTANSLFGEDPRTRRREAMETALRRIEAAFTELRKDPWSSDMPASADVLPTVLELFAEILSSPNPLSRKRDYAELAAHIPDEDLDPEVGEVLDFIVGSARGATPNGDF